MYYSGGLPVELWHSMLVFPCASRSARPLGVSVDFDKLRVAGPARGASTVGVFASGDGKLSAEALGVLGDGSRGSVETAALEIGIEGKEAGFFCLLLLLFFCSGKMGDAARSLPWTSCWIGSAAGSLQFTGPARSELPVASLLFPKLFSSAST